MHCLLWSFNEAATFQTTENGSGLCIGHWIWDAAKGQKMVLRKGAHGWKCGCISPIWIKKIYKLLHRTSFYLGGVDENGGLAHAALCKRTKNLHGEKLQNVRNITVHLHVWLIIRLTMGAVILARGIEPQVGVVRGWHMKGTLNHTGWYSVLFQTSLAHFWLPNQHRFKKKCTEWGMAGKWGM